MDYALGIDFLLGGKKRKQLNFIARIQIDATNLLNNFVKAGSALFAAAMIFSTDTFSIAPG